MSSIPIAKFVLVDLSSFGEIDAMILCLVGSVGSIVGKAHEVGFMYCAVVYIFKTQ